MIFKDKTCTRCKETKPENAFAMNRRDGLVRRRSCCMSCRKEIYARSKKRAAVFEKAVSQPLDIASQFNTWRHAIFKGNLSPTI